VTPRRPVGALAVVILAINTLRDIEKDEDHEAQSLNTGQFSLQAIERANIRARADAAKLAAHNAATAKGFPEDD